MDFPISVPSIGLVDGKFVDEDPLLGRPGSLIPSVWGNSITLEVLNVIEAAGLDPSEADLTQLLQAIRLIAQGDSGTFGNDTGAANVYTVAYSPAIPALANGLTLRFKAKTANTSASTFSPNGLMAKPLVGLGASALQGGEIVANGLCTVVYSATSDQWILVESTGGALQVAPATKSQHALQLGQATGRLLRTTIYINNAGTLQSSVDGGAFANASSTFTALSNTRFVIAEGFGGGASGGGSAATTAGQISAGSGGGCGAYAKGMFTSGFSGAMISVGAGGGPGAAGADGLSGGTTGFGPLMSIPGGIPGSGGIALTPPQVGSASGGPGTAPSGGNMISFSPQAGYPGMAITGGYGGPGASTMYGVGGSAPVAVGGRSGSGYGSGSSGSFSPGSTGTPRSSVAAQGGILIICEYA